MKGWTGYHEGVSGATQGSQQGRAERNEPVECCAGRWLRNQLAIDLCKRLGAIFLDDWKAVRIEGQALRRLAWQSKT